MDNTPRSLFERVRCNQNDEVSWRTLVNLYTPFLRRVLGHYQVPPADADDLMQDVFGVLVRELPHFEHSGQRGAFRA